MTLVIPAYYISAGLILFAAINTALHGVMVRRNPVYLSFTILALLVAAFQLASAHYYQTDSLQDAALALQWQTAFGLTIMPSIFAFIAYRTGQRQIAPWLFILTLLTVGLSIENFTSPYGLRLATLEIAQPLHLAWGETLYRIHGTPGTWNLIQRVIELFLIAWALWRIIVIFRCGRVREALLMGLCAALLIAATAWGALIDYEFINSFYLIGFAFTGLVLLMSVDLSLSTNVEIKQRLRAEAHIQEMAYQDYLTGLANRASFHVHLSDLIGRAISSGQHSAMLLIDLDHFKTINDALSHEIGDQVLREIARRLEDVAIEGVFVARLGGDEFVAIIEKMSPNPQESAMTAQLLAQSITAKLSEPITIGERILNVGASIGIAQFPQREFSQLDILRHADMALYRAKNLGRSAIEFYAPPMQIAANERLQLEDGLRMAVQNNELAMHFQAQMDSTGQVIGAEALMRWHHPQLGNIPPMTFIPVAEETGLIHSLGAWALDHSCERLMHWLKTGVPCTGRLSVNVSPWQFTRQDFVSLVSSILEKHGTDPFHLTLEITESALLYDRAATIEKLKSLRGMGLTISLDDFGTGYSSLSHLKDLPLDEIKIDQSFVRELTPGSNHALVESIIAVGRHMGLHVIAEGIETTQQQAILASMGCTRFQGYLFSHPLPENDFLGWLFRHKGSPNG